MTGTDRANQLMDSLGEVSSFIDLLDRYYALARELGVTGCYFWGYRRGALATLKDGDTEGAGAMTGGRGPIYLKPLEALYWRKEWWRSDPSLEAAEQHTAPFSTKDILNAESANAQMSEYLKFLDHYRIAQDLFLPFHTPGRIQVMYLFRVGPGRIDLSDPATREHLARLTVAFGLGLAEFTPTVGGAQHVIDLTVREQECLTLIARGHSTQDIAEQLGLSARTAKFHVENMMKKMNARTRAHAVYLAARSNWLTD